MPLIAHPGERFQSQATLLTRLLRCLFLSFLSRAICVIFSSWLFEETFVLAEWFIMSYLTYFEDAGLLFSVMVQLLSRR